MVSLRRAAVAAAIFTFSWRRAENPSATPARMSSSSTISLAYSEVPSSLTTAMLPVARMTPVASS